jgi:hypothetical protein
LMFNNSHLDFLFIVRHVTDGRQSIARLQVDQELKMDFLSQGFDSLEELLGDLDALTMANPKKAVEFVSGMADKLNAMSENTVRSTRSGISSLACLPTIDIGRHE